MRRRAARPAALPLFAALAALSLLGGCNAPWSDNSDRPETASTKPTTSWIQPTCAPA